MYLSKLGIINAPSRGIYEFGSKDLFKPTISDGLKHIDFNLPPRKYAIHFSSVGNGNIRVFNKTVEH